MSENTYLVRVCLRCDEHMSMHEKVCYCGGPVILKKVGLDKKTHSTYYPRRKFIRNLRRGQ